MKYRAARKVGWIWTRAGWKRVPLRGRRVKKVPPDIRSLRAGQHCGGGRSALSIAP